MIYMYRAPANPGFQEVSIICPIPRLKRRMKMKAILPDPTPLNLLLKW